jgi:hypothetical protein
MTRREAKKLVFYLQSIFIFLFIFRELNRKEKLNQG